MKWTPGPARCRSPEYEAEIAFIDMPDNRPILGRVREKGGGWCVIRWLPNGRTYSDEENGDDLMPPTITREALVVEILKKFGAPQPCTVDKQGIDVVTYIIDAVKSGRVE